MRNLSFVNRKTVKKILKHTKRLIKSNKSLILLGREIDEFIQENRELLRNGSKYNKYKKKKKYKAGVYNHTPQLPNHHEELELEDKKKRKKDKKKKKKKSKKD